MQQNAETIETGTTLKTDICIVGGGPAGISIAQSFIGHSASVIWIESGGLLSDEGVQELNSGTFGETPYNGLDLARHRQVGGSTRIWNTPVNGDFGAKYVPLDSCDFKSRSLPDYPGWPFEYSHLTEFYERAQTICGLGPFNYSGDFWRQERQFFSLSDERVRNCVYQFGSAKRFVVDHVENIDASDNIQLLFHATACALKMRNDGRIASEIEVRTLNGNRLKIKTRFVVLAAGAIENARLLLVSRDPGKNAPGDDHGWLGRCFMEHPRDYSMSLESCSRESFSQAAFYDRHQANDGTTISGRIGIDPATVIRDELPNASLTLLPKPHNKSWFGNHFKRVVSRARRKLGLNVESDGYGWSQDLNAISAYCGFRIILNVEQAPHPENRVCLSRDLDRLGVPKPEVHWRWRPRDQHNLERVKSVFAVALRDANIGKVQIREGVRPDPNAYHHAGTTRMHAERKLGVVDANGLVHGTNNVYVAGASVFPAAGYANPTLTVVAMALRVADQIKQRV
jgi:choline dehydrogenase-like flavoprotein